MNDAKLSVAESLNLELRRGVVVVAVLSQLVSEQYGYSLKRCLADRGMEIDEGTLYPLMRRLESQGLLVSDWRVENGRPRRYYRLSQEGLAVLNQLSSSWSELVRVMEDLLK